MKCILFGPHNRYAIEIVHTRFKTVKYFVIDAEVTDEITGMPAVIRQSETINVALKDLATPLELGYIVERLGWEES